MITLKTTHSGNIHVSGESLVENSPLYEKYIAFADSQKDMHTAWFLISMLLHSTVLVPLSFLLVYSLNGFVLPFLVTSMSLFFANIIANMGGASTRFTIFILGLSVVLHVLMAAITISAYLI